MIFTKSGRSNLTLERGRLYPVSINYAKNQERYLTEGMNPKVVSYSGTLQLFNLSFSYLSKDNFDGTVNGLKTWFQSTQINYSEYSFTLIDEDGVSHTVRLWDDDFEMGKDVSGRYFVTIKLLKELI
jgi:hypothetical protein